MNCPFAKKASGASPAKVGDKSGNCPHSNGLSVKKATVSRTLNEYELYKKELFKLNTDLDAAKERGCPYETKRAAGFCDETSNVLNDTKKRLLTYAQDLENYVEEALKKLKAKCEEAPEECVQAVEDAKLYLVNLSKDHPELGYTCKIN